MPDSLDVLEWSFGGNPLTAWLLALAGFAVVFVVLFLIRRLIRTRLASRARSTSTRLDDLLLELLDRTRYFFATIVGLAFGSRFLVFSDRTEQILTQGLALLLMLQFGLWGNALLDRWLELYTRRRITVDAASVTTMRAVMLVGKLLLWAVLTLVALQTLGVNVTALVAGLGIGGIAVALAVQSVLGDLIASFSIVLDKPFVVGDTIAAGDISGTVEEVGLKTTRLRSLSGEQIIVSNTDLARARVRNFKRMANRRIVFSIGVEYGTPVDKLEQIPGIIREILESLPNIRLDRTHFWSFGESALLIETVYFVLSPEYGLYMDIQQHVNLEILRRFEAMGVRIAVPTRTVVVRAATGEEGIRSSLTRATAADP